MSAFAAKLALKPHEFPSLSTPEKICWAKGSPACYPEMLVPRYDIWQIAYSRLTSSYFCICMWPAQLRPIFLPLRPARYQSTAALSRAATLVVAPENRNQVLTAK